MNHPPEPSKVLLTVLNNVFEAEQKLKKAGDPTNIQRNLTKIKDAFEELGLFFEDPMGQKFVETRTDLEGSISGTGTSNLVVVEVLKPIIREGRREYSRVVQKGIVIFESKKED